MNEIIELIKDSSTMPMIEKIKDQLPEINRATKNFGKKQSQFMDSTMTLSHLNPMRNLRQILAEIEKSKEGLQSAYFKSEKEKIEIEQLERHLSKSIDELEKRSISLSIQEKEAGLQSGEKYISGAIRKISAYITMYNEIIESFGAKNFDEIDFEKEEEKHHIMTAFLQGLNAARSHGGVIDEGNMIYLNQLGINGAVAQIEIVKYLSIEGKAIHEGIEPTFEDTLKFLHSMAEKFKGCSQVINGFKGMKTLIHDDSAVKNEI